MAAIFAADIYCDDCAEEIRIRLRAGGFEPANPEDERTYDSGDYPKHCGDDETSDTPEHCASGEDCLNAETLKGGKCGYFFRNGLTKEGVHYVAEAIAEAYYLGDLDSPAIVLWLPEYGEDGYTKGADCRQQAIGILVNLAISEHGAENILNLLAATTNQRTTRLLLRK